MPPHRAAGHDFSSLPHTHEGSKRASRVSPPASQPHVRFRVVDRQNKQDAPVSAALTCYALLPKSVAGPSNWLLPLPALSWDTYVHIKLTLQRTYRT